ncbi:hypothetical protein B296_00034758 [Ensete ventricosum]|uniref:Uncharacterized protein n=1 Tax=Ensete ventricosum TaxID=4639 RepID=A0A426XUF3_ENSVE|nr:hypothetical protein B296_00034758 [Ensete ventricosum]
MVASSPWRNELGPPVCAVGRGMWGRLVECSGFRLFDGCSCDIKGVSGAPLRIGGSGLLPSGIGQDQIAKRPGQDGGARRSSRADRLLAWPGWSTRLSDNRLFRLVDC